MNIEVGDRVTYIDLYMEEKYMDLITTEIYKDSLKDRKERNQIKFLKIERPNWEVVEEKKELLTDEEREYLKIVLKFLRLEIKSIRKNYNSYNETQIVFSTNEDSSGLNYWHHLKEKYFQNLKLNKNYTLKELRIGGINGRTTKGHKHR